MKQCIMVFVFLALVAAQVTKSPADHADSVVVNDLAGFNLTVEPVGDVLKDEASEPADTTIGRSPLSRYAIAYADAEVKGKLCVFIGAKWCGPCGPAKDRFRALAAMLGDVPCVELDINTDKDAPDLLDGHSLPCVIVYELKAGEWSRLRSGGDPQVMREIMLGEPTGQASFAAECVGGCQSCPANCAANGCGCEHSVRYANGHCGDDGWYPGKFFAERKPVRKVLKAGAVATGTVVAAVMWRIAHPCGGRFRCR